MVESGKNAHTSPFGREAAKERYTPRSCWLERKDVSTWSASGGVSEKIS